MPKYISELRFVETSNFLYPPGLIMVDEFKERNSQEIVDGCIIYVLGDAIDHFADRVLPYLPDIKFKLITGLSDRVVPQSEKSRIVLNHPKLLAWFAPNAVEDHPKLYHLPLGIPKHLPRLYTPTDPEDKGSPYMAWPKASVGLSDTMEKMYDSLKGSILDRMKAKVDSDKLLFISYTTVNSDNCYLKENDGFRRRLDEYWEQTPFTKSPLLDWIEYIQTLKEYKFTIEPPGRCLDGYRVWEALYVGTMPIVFRSSISPLHEDLPVLIVDSFEEINEENLRRKYVELLDREHAWEKLDVKYWIKRIKDLPAITK